MNITDDTKILINYSVDFAEQMLIENEEFFPFACTINSMGELVPISFFDGDEFPKSETLIDNLETILDNQLKQKEKRAYALTYDVKVKRHNEFEMHDAIAVKIKHIETEQSIVYFFAYKLNSQKSVEHLHSWLEVV